VTAVSTTASVHEIAAELLTACETILATTVGGPVQRAYLYPGLPALDFACDQVAVYQSGIGEEQMSPLTPIPVVGQRQRLGRVNLVSLTVMAARCIRVGRTTTGGYTPPTVSAVTEDAEKIMEDGWALWCGISAAIREDGLFGGTCQDIKLLGMIPMLPQGALAGWTLTIQFELGGIPE